ncbi:MAG: hypothetical protein DDG60_01435 [Anaerolineae bacterium]|nr:MAG: hypothetical protein DDG60_01435 [Anaerolineae bacterium]
MFVILSLSILLLTLLVMAVLRLTRRPAAFSWLAAALGALLSWASTPLWQIDLPTRLPVSSWPFSTLFHTTPALQADSFSWLYAISLVALASAVVLTSPARLAVLSPISWFGAVALGLVGLLAVMADNILTLSLMWMAIDLLEYLNTLRMTRSSSNSERAVISLAFRAAGTGFALWAAVISARTGLPTSLQQTPPEAWLFLLLAVGLRLGVIPLHLPYRQDLALRRGIGSSLRLTAAATSLVVLARLPAGDVDETIRIFLLALVALAAIYAAWKWFSSSDEISARPYWIIGMSALSLAAALRGNPQGSAAWGVSLVLFGGLLFLYSSRQIWLTRLLAGFLLCLLSLPFTLTASGWLGNFPWPALFWPLFLTAHVMLIAGYIRHLSRSGDTPLSELPRWSQVSYPLGLATLMITVLLTGLWGWPGSLQIGNWSVALLMVGLTIPIGIAYWKLNRFLPTPEEQSTLAQVSHFVRFQEFLARLLWAIYRLFRRLVEYVSSLLEGDGGLLWTLLLLLILITALRGL